MSEVKAMTVEETESLIIIENAPLQFSTIIGKLPWKLFWWEGYLSDGLFTAVFHPKGVESSSDIVGKPLNESFDLNGIEEEDASITFTFYFYKEVLNESRYN